MSNATLDVIVAAYNAERTIEKCLNSILAQSHKPTRAIVVDDGSTDRTFDIVNEMSNRNPGRIILKTQANSGPAAARNLGISCASAEFLGFVDADDFIADNMYSDMLSVSDDETDLVICGRNDVLKDGTLKAVLPNKQYNDANIFSNKSFLYGTSAFVWDKIFRKKIIDKFKVRFPEQVRYAEDAVFLTIFKLHSRKCKVLQKPFYYYMESSEGSITNECSATWLDIPSSLEIINKYYAQKGRFFYFRRELEILATGFYKRRINSLPVHTNKIMQLKYIKSHVKFMNRYFSGWKTRVSLLYKNTFITNAFALCPNSLKRNALKLKRLLKKSKSQRVLYRYLQKTLPVNKKTSLYLSYSGDSVSDSPMYLAKEEFSTKNSNIYFASRNIDKDRIFCRLNNLHFNMVSVNSVKYVWLLATAGRIVNNSRLPTYFNKRKNQIILNTWHGTPIKTLGASMSSGIKDIGRNQNQFLMSDFLLFPNNFTRERMIEDFSLSKTYSGDALLGGYPRNDPFFTTDSRIKLELKAKLGIDDKKLVIYMPTWRGASIGQIDHLAYTEELDNIFSELDNKLSNDTMVYVKLHQSVGRTINDGSYEKIRAFPDGYDPYQILSCSDVLVTDYSSVMFDYLYHQKPIILFLYDYDEYVRERGFYIDVKNTPFSKAYCSDELASLLNEENIPSDYNTYIELFCPKPNTSFSQDLLSVIYKTKTANSTSKEQSFHIEVFDGVTIDEDEAKILAAAENPDTIVVFHHSDVNERTEQFIHTNKSRLDPFLIVPGEMPITVGEKLSIYLFESYGLMRNASRKALLNECSRIFPGINLSRITNHSKRKKFSTLAKVIRPE